MSGEASKRVSCVKEHVSCFAPWRTGGHFCLISVLHVSDPGQEVGGGELDWGEGRLNSTVSRDGMWGWGVGELDWGEGRLNNTVSGDGMWGRGELDWGGGKAEQLCVRGWYVG